MFIKIYFGDKPVFLCDEINTTIHEYMHHPDAIFIDEISTPAINTLLHEIAKPEFHAGILWHKDLEKLKKVFFRHFVLVQTGGGLVTNENKEVLMILRRGKWDLPKGKLDNVETIEACALREVQEETGLKNIDLGDKITITYHTYNEFGKHILKESHWFHMKGKSEEKLVAQTEEDITDIRWIKQKDLKKYTQNTFATIIEVLGSLKK
jgi:8-oxo-dGTP pyrophosphatase MutT (NUDIX family)